MDLITCIKLIVKERGVEEIAKSTFFGLLCDYGAFEEESNEAAIKHILKLWLGNGKLEKISKMSSSDSQWKIDASDIIHQTESEGFKKEVASDLLHKLLLGIGIVDSSFNWDLEFLPNEKTKKEHTGYQGGYQPGEYRGSSVSTTKADTYFSTTSTPKAKPHRTKSGFRKFVSFLKILTIFGCIVALIVFFVFKPRVSIDSKKKLELVLSPQYCEREFALKSNKSHLDFIADEPWTTGQIIDNLLKIKVEENNTGKERVNILGVKAKRAQATIVLRQMPHVSYLNVEKDVVIEQLGGETTITVSTDAFDMEIGACPSWCKATVADKQIVLDCESNSDNYVRVGQVEIVADTAHVFMNIKQAGSQGTKTEEECNADFILKHYIGDLKDGVPNGKGVMNYLDEGTYEGTFVNGKPHGRGKYVWPNGNVYEGDFKNGKMSGKGTCKYANGSIYEGEWMNGERQGKGKGKYANGDVYEGEWMNGEKQGKGKMKFANGDVYEGEWKDGEKQGKGKYVWPNGDVYEGEWMNGERQGKGKCKFANGDVYEGEWKDDKRHGKGKYVWPNGNVYEGEWKDDKRHGKGKMKYANGAIYEGEWNDGYWNGKGTLKYADGGVYEGEFKDGQQHGKGTLKYADGGVYEGKFKDGQRHGKGTFTDVNGKKTQGVWRNDEFKFRW